MAEIGVDAVLDRLSDWVLSPNDSRARRYVGAFVNRRRLGGQILAEVEGNHGTYTVSLDVDPQQPRGGCNCYIGAGGGCHHVRALAQTFLDEPGSFVARVVHGRDRLRSLEDLVEYLETSSLEGLLADLDSLGVKRQQVGRVLGTATRTLSRAVEKEQRNAGEDTAGALKLACLYLLEWREAAAGDDDLARALAGRSRRELVDLIGELIEPLGPDGRGQFLARLGPEPEPGGDGCGLDAARLLGDIERFLRDCEEGEYYGLQGHSDGDEYYGDDQDESDAEPDPRAIDLLDDLLARTEQHFLAGDDATAVAAYEKLFGILWGDTEEMFGFEEVERWLETDARQAVHHYLASLGHLCPPGEYVRRAWACMGWAHTDLLNTASSPEQQEALVAYLLDDVSAETEVQYGAPISLYQLRDLYRHQGRIEEELALYRHWRHRWPDLFGPLMDHAEQTGDWAGLESLVRESLAEESRERVMLRCGIDRQGLELRLGRALEQQGDLEGSLASIQRVFAARPDQEGYRRMSELAVRLSPERRRKIAAEAIDLLRKRVSSGRMPLYDDGTSGESNLLARILLAEGRHSEAFELATAAQGRARIGLLTVVGNAYLAFGWGELPARGSVVRRALDQYGVEDGLRPEIPEALARDEALSRAGECYHRLAQIHVEARGRDNYAAAAKHAAVMREVYSRRGNRAVFDHWYAELMDTYVRFRALREEFRRQLGQEPGLGCPPA